MQYFQFLIPFLLLSLFQAPAIAVKKSYVVYLGSHSHGPKLTAAHLHRVTHSHYELLGSFLGSHEEARDAIFYSYQWHINGFAANLEEEVAAEIANHPEVVSVFPNEERQLQTTHSWDFMMLGKYGVFNPRSLWRKARFGRDTIIATIDTGVWPESESFSDKGMGPVPARWRGVCENNTAAAGVPCNRKLIGARSFASGYQHYHGIQNMTITPRDMEGHGTHTLSTAGGNFVAGVSAFGLGYGTASGGSPKARVASYKVCWPGCFDADIIAAFDMAIHDGVDVLSASLGGQFPRDFFNDGVAIGSFHAVKHGITVVCAAGNFGPYSGTVTNVAPWMITVAASTLDRSFQALVSLHDGQQFQGTSLSAALPEHKYYPLLSGNQAKAANATADRALLCLPGTLDPEKVKGKILTCLRGISSRVDKGEQALLAGAVGMILCNDEESGDDLISDPQVLPASQIVYSDGLKVLAYINSTENPFAYLAPPEMKLNTKPAPVMAVFSSRGPNLIAPQILKPDITAPGVNIIAAFPLTTSPSELSSDKRRVPFNIMSGTSMSCPHVAGLAGLLRTLYPRWSSAAIQSAIMTTARTRDNAAESIRNANLSLGGATPFAYGSGHIRPNQAMDPGLVYDLTISDYMDLLCASGYNQTLLQLFWGSPYKCPQNASLFHFNYPSMAVVDLRGPITLRRRVKNVGLPATYVARILAPEGVSVSVEPGKLEFERTGEEKSFTVTLRPKGAAAPRHHVFGGLIWTDGKHNVRSPIAVAHESLF